MAWWRRSSRRLGGSLRDGTWRTFAAPTMTSLPSRAAGAGRRARDGLARQAPEPERRVPVGRRGKGRRLMRVRPVYAVLERELLGWPAAHAARRGDGAAAHLAARHRRRLRRIRGRGLQELSRAGRSGHDHALRRDARGARHGVRQGIRRDAHDAGRAVAARLDRARKLVSAAAAALRRRCCCWRCSRSSATPDAARTGRCSRPPSPPPRPPAPASEC